MSHLWRYLDSSHAGKLLRCLCLPMPKGEDFLCLFSLQGLLCPRFFFRLSNSGCRATLSEPSHHAVVPLFTSPLALEKLGNHSDLPHEPFCLVEYV